MNQELFKPVAQPLGKAQPTHTQFFKGQKTIREALAGWGYTLVVNTKRTRRKTTHDTSDLALPTAHRSIMLTYAKTTIIVDARAKGYFASFYEVKDAQPVQN